MTQAELRNIRGHAKGVRVNINLVFIGDRPEWHLLNLLWLSISPDLGPCRRTRLHQHRVMDKRGQIYFFPIC